MANLYSLKALREFAMVVNIKFLGKALHSLKLTEHLKIDGLEDYIPFGKADFPALS